MSTIEEKQNAMLEAMRMAHETNKSLHERVGFLTKELSVEREKTIQLQQELEAARAEIEHKKEYIDILSKGWPAADILKLQKQLAEAYSLYKVKEQSLEAELADAKAQMSFLEQKLADYEEKLNGK